MKAKNLQKQSENELRPQHADDRQMRKPVIPSDRNARGVAKRLYSGLQIRVPRSSLDYPAPACQCIKKHPTPVGWIRRTPHPPFAIFGGCASLIHPTRLEDHKAKAFTVPREEIAENKYDLSINRYKEIEYEEEEYDPPLLILDQLDALEKEIQADLKELREML